MGVKSESTFVLVCRQTRDLSKLEVEKVNALRSILNPGKIDVVVDFMPIWAMPNFRNMMNLYGTFMQAASTTMPRVYKSGLTVCLFRQDDTLLTFQNFPKGMSTGEWMYYTEQLPDEITAFMPADTIPVSEGVISSHYVDGQWQWRLVDVQSWATQDKSPGYSLNLVVFKEQHLDDGVTWLLNYVGAISIVVEYLLKVREPGIAQLLQAIALDRMYQSWPDKREQIQAEFAALNARLFSNLKADFNIPDRLGE